MDAPWADDPVRSWQLVALEPVRQVLSDHYILDVELLLASLEDSVGSRLHFYGKAHSAALADESHSTRFEYPPDSPKDSHQARRLPIGRQCATLPAAAVPQCHSTAGAAGALQCLRFQRPCGLCDSFAAQSAEPVCANGPGSSQSKAQRVDLGRPCRWYSALKS